jgi:hypothetical protein
MSDDLAVSMFRVAQQIHISKRFLEAAQNIFLPYGSTALYGPGPPRFVEVSWSHTFETHHSR